MAETGTLGEGSPDTVTDLPGYAPQTAASKALVFNMDEMKVCDILRSDRVTDDLWSGGEENVDSPVAHPTALYEPGQVSLMDLIGNSSSPAGSRPGSAELSFS